MKISPSNSPTKLQAAVWEALKLIPKGKITTYSEIARHLGQPNASRAVGSAVGKNPEAPQIPCHRVIPKSGKIGNYSGPGGTTTKIKLLKKEGIEVQNGKIQNFSNKFWRFH